MLKFVNSVGGLCTMCIAALLMLWMLLGGIPWYVNWLSDSSIRRAENEAIRIRVIGEALKQNKEYVDYLHAKNL